MTLPVGGEQYEEAFLRQHVRFGFVPGGYANERFGRPGRRMLLSITNATANARSGRIRLDAGRLKLPSRPLRSTDLIVGKTLEWRAEKEAVVATVRLETGEALVLELTK